jgi:SHS2 domain-containing protein
MDIATDTMTSLPPFTLINHTADLGFKVCGRDITDLFQNAAIVLTRLMIRTRRGSRATPLAVCLRGHDLQDLMVQWLGEILYLFEGENLVLSSSAINRIMPTRIEATFQMTPYDPDLHEVVREIKAVTYHDIEVIEKNGQWEAVVILDV